jgi:hypothetical protein
MFETLRTAIQTIKGWFSHAANTVTEPGFKQTPASRRVVLAIVTLAVGLLAWSVSHVIQAWTSVSPATDSVQDGERLLFAIAALGRGTVAMVLIPLAVFLALFLFKVIDRTKTGEHLMEWRPKDTEGSEAAKTANAGLIFAALLLGIFIMLAQVIR